VGTTAPALQELGWIEGKNLVIERRYAKNQLDRLPGLAAGLVSLNVDVIGGNETLALTNHPRTEITSPACPGQAETSPVSQRWPGISLKNISGCRTNWYQLPR
jgi:hypothetical protein